MKTTFNFECESSLYFNIYIMRPTRNIAGSKIYSFNFIKFHNTSLYISEMKSLRGYKSNVNVEFSNKRSFFFNLRF